MPIRLCSELPTTYETIRGANDLPKITHTPSYKEKGRPEVNARLLVCAKE